MLTLFVNFVNIILTSFIPFLLPPVMYFHLDPGYYIINNYIVKISFEENLTVFITILVIRLVLFYLYVLSLCRCFGFIYLLEASRLHMYSYCLTLLRKLRQVRDFYRTFQVLRICHHVLCLYCNKFYHIYPIFCQASIVGFLWFCIMLWSRLPIIILLCSLTFAINLTVVICFTMAFSCSIHYLSDDCLWYWRWHNKSDMIVSHGGYWARKSRAQKPLRNRFGDYADLSIKAIMIYLNILLQNLANSILLIDF